jgi:hypothetical protein
MFENSAHWKLFYKIHETDKLLSLIIFQCLIFTVILSVTCTGTKMWRSIFKTLHIYINIFYSVNQRLILNQYLYKKEYFQSWLLWQFKKHKPVSIYTFEMEEVKNWSERLLTVNKIGQPVQYLHILQYEKLSSLLIYFKLGHALTCPWYWMSQSSG